jgi:hypothetical protein
MIINLITYIFVNIINSFESIELKVKSSYIQLILYDDLQSEINIRSRYLSEESNYLILNEKFKSVI